MHSYLLFNKAVRPTSDGGSSGPFLSHSEPQCRFIFKMIPSITLTRSYISFASSISIAHPLQIPQSNHRTTQADRYLQNPLPSDTESPTSKRTTSVISSANHSTCFIGQDKRRTRPTWPASSSKSQVTSGPSLVGAGYRYARGSHVQCTVDVKQRNSWSTRVLLW